MRAGGSECEEVAEAVESIKGEVREVGQVEESKQESWVAMTGRLMDWMK